MREIKLSADTAGTFRSVFLGSAQSSSVPSDSHTQEEATPNSSISRCHLSGTAPCLRDSIHTMGDTLKDSISSQQAPNERTQQGVPMLATGLPVCKDETLACEIQTLHRILSDPK